MKPVRRTGPRECHRLRLQGRNHRELGARSAEAFGRASRYIVKMLSRKAARDPAWKDSFHKAAARHARLLDTRWPQRVEELQGFSRGLGMHPDDVVCARLMLESLLAPRCTNFGAVGPATEDGGVMISWNFDVPPFFKLLMGRFPLFVRDVDGTNPYLCLGLGPLFGVGILNAEGLCSVVNAVGITDDGEGYGPFELNNRAMETCSTVTEARAVFSENPRQATRAMFAGLLMNWNMIWADLSGGLEVFEYSHNHFHAEPAGPKGVIASTNHHQFLDRELSGSFDPSDMDEIAGSYSRLARMWSLLEQYHGKIGPFVAKLIISDHIPDYSLLREYGIEREWWQDKVDDSTICAHPWNWKKHLLNGDIEGALVEYFVSATIYSLQIQPESSTVWFTRGNPCRNPTLPVYWGSLLGTDVRKQQDAFMPWEVGRLQVEDRRRGLFRSDAGPLEAALTRLWFRVIGIIEDYAFRTHME